MLFGFSKQARAFTLAEVLITLGIIGVVAAMTLPALIQKQQRLETSARLKKFYSVMNQAVVAAQSEYGDPMHWSKLEYILDENGNYDYGTYNKEAESIFNTYFLPYLKVLKLSEGQTPGVDSDGKPVAGKYPVIYFPDGSSMQIKMGTCFDMYYDSNGAKRPNEFGKDKFIFYFCYKHKKPIIDSLSTYKVNSREDALARCKRDSSHCAILLHKFDNWEFKKDYPW